MSRVYAQLNNENICIAVSVLSGEVSGEHMVEIDSFDPDFYLRRVFLQGKWQEAKMDAHNHLEVLSNKLKELELEIDSLVRATHTDHEPSAEGTSEKEVLLKK